MPRVWRIARYHFLFEIRKRSFILALLSLPLLIGFSVAFGFLAESLNQETTWLGYVDRSGFLTDTAINEDVHLVKYDTAADAQKALDNDELNAYYILSLDFANTRDAELVYYNTPKWQAQVAFNDMVQRNHLANVPPEIAERVLAGSNIRVRPLNSSRTFGGSPEVADFLPLLTALIFSFLTVTTSGYMMEALVTEKENRTMEIVISSISSEKLITGKIIGVLGIAAVQLLVWVACALLGVVIGRAAGVSWLQELHPRWQDIVQIIIVSIPVYFFLAALFTTIGATLVESTEAQQIGPFAFLILLLPVYVLPTFLENPDGPLALFLTFFPPTASVSFALRMLLSTIPWPQLLISVAISLACAATMTWLAAKSFRLGMLRYGQRLKLRELLRRAPTY